MHSVSKDGYLNIQFHDSDIIDKQDYSKITPALFSSKFLRGQGNMPEFYPCSPTILINQPKFQYKNRIHELIIPGLLSF